MVEITWGTVRSGSSRVYRLLSLRLCYSDISLETALKLAGIPDRQTEMNKWVEEEVV